MASNNNKIATAAAPSLNVYKKVAVIRHPSDSLTYDDAEGNQKSVSIDELGDAISSAVSFSLPPFLWLIRCMHAQCGRQRFLSIIL